MSFGADIIAGFPTETEEMFENSLRLAEECGIAKLHVFPFSPRPGTPAARMPQLDRGVGQGSAPHGCAPLGERLHLAHLAGMVGTVQRMLVENTGMAHTENFTLVDGSGLPPGDSCEVRITGHNGKHLTCG